MSDDENKNDDAIPGFTPDELEVLAEAERPAKALSEDMSKFGGIVNTALRHIDNRLSAIDSEMQAMKVLCLGAKALTYSPVPEIHNYNMASVSFVSDKEACLYIMGSGPSLGKVDVQLLRDVPTLSLNRSYVAWEDWGFTPTFYAAIERKLTDCNPEDTSKERHPFRKDWEKIFKDFMDGKSPHSKLPMLFLNCESSLLRFSEVLKQAVDSGLLFQCPVTPPLRDYGDGQTLEWLKPGGVFHNLRGSPLRVLSHLPLPLQQNGGAWSVVLAYMLGFKRVVLLGVDANYTGRQESIDKGEDVEHFHPKYFDPSVYEEGQTHGSPDEWHGILPWKLLKDLDLPDFEIVSCSPGSKINSLFEYKTLEELLIKGNNDEQD